MRPVAVTARIAAPRERVYQLIADLAARPAFTDHFMREMRLQRIESRGVGASLRFRLDAPRAAIWMESVITEAEEPYRIIERGRGGRIDRIPVHTAWELAPGPGETTDVTVAFAIEPVNRADLLRYRLLRSGWYRRQWRKALSRLREIAETGAEPERVGVGGASRVAVRAAG